MTQKAKMTPTKLSVEQMNFAYVAIACVDVIKLPLIDILHSNIDPENLLSAIQQCTALMTGHYQLDPDQKAKCGFTSPNQSPKTPDYSEFDVTLVSTLIQNLCPKLQPLSRQQSTQLWKEIENIRRIKNRFLSHASIGKLDEPTFNDTLTSMKNVMNKIQMLTTKMKYRTNYTTPLDDLKKMTVDAKKYESLIEKLKGKFAFHTQMHFRPVNQINLSNK